VKIGTAPLGEAYPAGARRMVFATPTFSEPGRDNASIKAFQTSGQEPAVRGPINARPAADATFVGGLVMGVIALLGTLAAYWLCGVRPGTVEFLINTDFEMKKVNWSTWAQVRGSTIVVIIACFALAGVLALFDVGLSQFFKLIRVFNV
jgi:preprotein translocase SecE subunit